MKKIIPVVFLALLGWTSTSFAAQSSTAPAISEISHSMRVGQVLINSPAALVNYVDRLATGLTPWAQSTPALTSSSSGWISQAHVTFQSLAVLTVKSSIYIMFAALALVLFLNISFITVVGLITLASLPLLLFKKVRATLKVEINSFKALFVKTASYCVFSGVLLVPYLVYQVHLDKMLQTQGLAPTSELFGLSLTSPAALELTQLIFTLAILGTLCAGTYVLLIIPGKLAQRLAARVTSDAPAHA